MHHQCHKNHHTHHFLVFHYTSSSTSPCSGHHDTSSPTSRHHSWYNAIFLPFHQPLLKVGSALLAWAESIHPVRENIFRTPTTNILLLWLQSKQSEATKSLNQYAFQTNKLLSSINFQVTIVGVVSCRTDIMPWYLTNNGMSNVFLQNVCVYVRYLDDLMA